MWVKFHYQDLDRPLPLTYNLNIFKVIIICWFFHIKIFSSKVKFSTKRCVRMMNLNPVIEVRTAVSIVGVEIVYHSVAVRCSKSSILDTPIHCIINQV